MVTTAMKNNTHINPYSAKFKNCAVFALNLSRQIKKHYNAISVNYGVIYNVMVYLLNHIQYNGISVQSYKSDKYFRRIMDLFIMQNSI